MSKRLISYLWVYKQSFSITSSLFLNIFQCIFLCKSTFYVSLHLMLVYILFYGLFSILFCILKVYFRGVVQFTASKDLLLKYLTLDMSRMQNGIDKCLQRSVCIRACILSSININFARIKITRPLDLARLLG